MILLAKVCCGCDCCSIFPVSESHAALRYFIHVSNVASVRAQRCAWDPALIHAIDVFRQIWNYVPWIDARRRLEWILLMLCSVFALRVVRRQWSLSQVCITTAPVRGTFRLELLAGTMAEFRFDLFPVFIDHSSVIWLVAERYACFWWSYANLPDFFCVLRNESRLASEMSNRCYTNWVLSLYLRVLLGALCMYIESVEPCELPHRPWLMSMTVT